MHFNGVTLVFFLVCKVNTLVWQFTFLPYRNETNAQFVQMPGNQQLVLNGQAETLLLSTVAQSGVVDVELAHRDLISSVPYPFRLVLRPG